MKKKEMRFNLLVLCYGTAFLLLVLLHFAGFVYNKILYANGTLVQKELTLDDFELANDILMVEGTLITVGADPQLVLKDSSLRVDTLYMEIEYSRPARQVNALYGSVQDGAPEDYSVRRMVFARESGEVSVFWLPVYGVQCLRVDPGSVAYNTLIIKRIVVNQPRPLYAFFMFSTEELTALAVVPALLACGVRLLIECRATLRKHKKAGEAA